MIGQRVEQHTPWQVARAGGGTDLQRFPLIRLERQRGGSRALARGDREDHVRPIRREMREPVRRLAARTIRCRERRRHAAASRCEVETGADAAEHDRVIRAPVRTQAHEGRLGDLHRRAPGERQLVDRALADKAQPLSVGREERGVGTLRPGDHFRATLPKPTDHQVLTHTGRGRVDHRLAVRRDGQRRESAR